MRGCRRRMDFAGGFTLIEVMAALVIVSLGMLGVIQAVNQTVNNTSYLREKTLAHWVAMNRLTEVRLAAAAPAKDTTSGTAQMAGRDWRWTMAVNQAGDSNLLRIDVSVAAADADEDSSLASVSGFYGAAVAPAGSARVPWTPNPSGQAGQNNPPGQQNTNAGDTSGGDGTNTNGPAANEGERR